MLDGSIVAGHLVKRAVERHVEDFENSEALEIFFDLDGPDRVFRFFSLLRHSKGEWAGEQFLLSPWQCFIVVVLFGWKRADGTRRFRTVYIQVARKNGKTTFLAGIGLYLAFADREPGAEVYTAATKRDQARIAHSEATRMRAQSPELTKRITAYRDNLHIVAKAQKFEPLGADADTMDGLNPHGNIIDELHAHKNRKLWDVLETATGARRQPMTIAITTAGFDMLSICWEQREYSEKILDGHLPDESYFAFIAEPDKDDDWHDEATWHKGNPNLGVSVKLDDLRDKYRKAAASPAAQNTFRRLRLDEWTEQEDRWLDMTSWNACPSVKMALEGHECFGGLDLSSTIDLTALVLAFRSLDDPEGVIFQPYFWIPEENIKDREARDRAPYKAWVRDGWIRTTPGSQVDYDFIRQTTNELGDLFKIKEIAFDRWNSSQIVTQLTDDGFTMVPFGQGYASMSGPSKELARLVTIGKVWHMDNPVLRWMASNVQAEQDAAGNIKPSKAKSRLKIDGIVASIMALDRLMRQPKAKKSVYARRGMATT